MTQMRVRNCEEGPSSDMATVGDAVRRDLEG